MDENESSFVVLQRILDHPSLALDELGLVISDADPTEQYAPFIIRDSSKLGVPFGVIPQLYSFALQQLKNLLTQVVNDSSSVNDLVQCTRTLLLINADLGTAWNIRKKLLLAGQMLTWLGERKFLDLVFSKHSKMQEAWNQRRFVTARLLKDPSENQLQVIQHELRICDRACDIYPKNYMGWTYRQWLIFEAVQLSLFMLLDSEWELTKRWVLGHLSDHAGVHYRQKILLMITMSKASIDAQAADLMRQNIGMDVETRQHDVQDAVAVKKMWQDEWAWSTQILEDFPGHETQWAHRRFLAFMGLAADLFNLDHEADFLERTLSQTAINAQSTMQRKWAIAYLVFIINTSKGNSVHETLEPLLFKNAKLSSSTFNEVMRASKQ